MSSEQRWGGYCSGEKKDQLQLFRRGFVHKSMKNPPFSNPKRAHARNKEIIAFFMLNLILNMSKFINEEDHGMLVKLCIWWGSW